MLINGIHQNCSKYNVTNRKWRASDLFREFLSHEYMFAMKANLFTKKHVLNITLYCHSAFELWWKLHMLTEICSENSPFHLSGISAPSLLSRFYGGNKVSYPERGGKDGRFIFSRIIIRLRCIFAKSYPSQWRASVRKLMWKFSHFWIWIYGFMLIYGFSHLWIFLDALPPQLSSTESQSIVVWACKLSLHG